MSYLISLDAGTTSIRAFLYDIRKKRFVYRAQQEVESRFPHPGWVEQDAGEIYFKAACVLDECVRAAQGEILGLGITNQRETVVCFDAKSGQPVSGAIVWQCRRTAEFCASIPPADAARISEITGLLPDAYFSASKIAWILQNVPEAAELLKRGRLRAGTVDSYLLFRLTGNFFTDYTNASRTMLFDLHTLDWDDGLLAYFDIPRGILPTPLPCDARMGETVLGGKRVPVAGVLGDQQAALFGQACLHPGEGKATYGTGLFLLFSTGERPVRSANGLLTTVAASYGGKRGYALEGSVFHAGSAVQWLRDEMGLLEHAADSERLAASVSDTGGVFFVPAFTGLGAPHWKPTARAMLTGITRGTRKEHVVRAVLESIAYEARDLVDAMQKDSGIAFTSLKCDGGASANDFLMQFQSDVLGVPVDRPVERESTALGAAFMTSIALGLGSEEEIASSRRSEKIFLPSPDRETFEALYRGYRKALSLAGI